MSKVLKQAGVLIAVCLIVTLGGCAHKPAYSDIDVNKNSRNQNNNETSPLAEALKEATPQPGPGAEPGKQKMPSFLAPNGSIKDLPAYPKAARVSVQIGPIQEAQVMMLQVQTSDPMEKVQAFYTQAIKENNWTLTDKLIDPEVSEWTLTKDERNNAKVQAKKDPKTGAIFISIVRAEKNAPVTK